jgi:hypothetical protein
MPFTNDKSEMRARYRAAQERAQEPCENRRPTGRVGTGDLLGVVAEVFIIVSGTLGSMAGLICEYEFSSKMWSGCAVLLLFSKIREDKTPNIGHEPTAPAVRENQKP